MNPPEIGEWHVLKESRDAEQIMAETKEIFLLLTTSDE